MTRLASGASGRSLEHLASSAAAGDRDALNELLARMQHPIYRLALRFLGHPADAEDAIQEILVRLTAPLSTFEGRSAFTTWACTVAVRMLLRTRKRLTESSVVSAERFGVFLDAGLADHDYLSPETPEQATLYRELCDEIRVSCTYGMLLCLTRSVRAAYLCRCARQIGASVAAGILDPAAPTYRDQPRIPTGSRLDHDVFEKAVE